MDGGWTCCVVVHTKGYRRTLVLFAQRHEVLYMTVVSIRTNCFSPRNGSDVLCLMFHIHCNVPQFTIHRRTHRQYLQSRHLMFQHVLREFVAGFEITAFQWFTSPIWLMLASLTVSSCIFHIWSSGTRLFDTTRHSDSSLCVNRRCLVCTVAIATYCNGQFMLWLSWSIVIQLLKIQLDERVTLLLSFSAEIHHISPYYYHYDQRTSVYIGLLFCV